MPNSRFNTMISQHCLSFKQLFVELSQKLFGTHGDTEDGYEVGSFFQVPQSNPKDPSASIPFHSGEFGSHRELISTKYLRPFTPDRFDLVNGFIIGANEDLFHGNEEPPKSQPSQCDILVIERDLAPFCQQRELGQFYPMEAVSAIGEVKSQLTYTKFSECLVQISKQAREFRNIGLHQVLSYGESQSRFDFRQDKFTGIGIHGTDAKHRPLIFLICRCFKGNGNEVSGSLPLWSKVREKIDQHISLADNRIKPDLVLSLTDGLLIIRTQGGQIDYQCISPGRESTTHLKTFLSIYFSHLVQWHSQSFTIQQYFQMSELDIVFEDNELQSGPN